MDFYDRIEALLLERNEKRLHLAEVLGLQNQSFTNWKKRRNIPAADIVLKIAQHFDVSMEWLLTGTDKKESFSVEERHLISIFRELSDANKANIVQMATIWSQQGKSISIVG